MNPRMLASQPAVSTDSLPSNGHKKRLDGAEQKTTAHLLCWGARERMCWMCESAQLARLWWSL
jgi:hypothetical protein